MPANLYVHFPFCRRKCTYCALYSRAGVSQTDRDAYVRGLVDEIAGRGLASDARFGTVYFGGGSPAICDLRPLLSVLGPLLAADYEFTVELHPLDVTDELLQALKAGGVNRISMGVQSLDDAVLAGMGRGYTLDGARSAFELVKRYFDNAGIDLIVGYPGSEWEMTTGAGERLGDWGLRHCSVYSLQNERGLKGVPDDETVLDAISRIAAELKGIGLERYEISNYAVPGFECRHNLSVWRGEDYLGIGEGAHGRVELVRTAGKAGSRYSEETVSPEFDRRERALFRLRTREGLDASAFPEWKGPLDLSVAEGLLRRDDNVYFLTERGTEVCDSILEELV